MRQIFQSLTDGRTLIEEAPLPQTPRGGMLIRSRATLISAGTERMLVDFGRAGWIQKAMQQPAKVRQVLDKIRTDGLMPALEAVRSKIEQPLPLGYCNVGVVVEAGNDVTGFSPGDRVVSNGPHADFVVVPKNLCARIPDSVDDDSASFAVLGAIGLQGIRLAAPTLGERFVVVGLGLIGLLTVQLLRAAGCAVLGVDPDAAKSALARRFGADTVDLGKGEDPVAVANVFSAERGVDGVIITASTDSNEPVSQAARMCRVRGRVILVGVAGLDLDRNEFYRKEISFQVSCSYGPGRYDSDYEEGGNDYPFGFVRWTEQRNFEAVLDMMARGALDMRPLITHRFAFDRAADAYELLSTGREPYIGILLEYPDTPSRAVAKVLTLESRATLSTAAPRVAFIGAGNYAARLLVPAFARTTAKLAGIASSGGTSAARVGRKFGFATATSDADALVKSPEVDALVIATRHDSHARYVLAALAAEKHVFVEKPLAIDLADLDAIESAWRALPADRRPVVTVGFNRRFSPHAVRMRDLLSGLREPRSCLVTVNAGAVPRDHWTQDPRRGGERIIGEGCHFVDLLRFLVGHSIVGWHALPMIDAGGNALTDRSILTLRFADGSIGAIHYLANGHSALPKERVEVFCGGRTLQLENFRRLRGNGWPDFSSNRLWRQDKGQDACAKAFVDAVASGSPPIPFEEILEVSRVSILLGEAARHGAR